MISIYLDNISGISGDIFVAAFLQIKPAFKEINEILSGIFENEVTLKLDNIQINGISTKRLKIETENIEIAGYRHIDNIFSLLDKSGIEENLLKKVKNIFLLLASAESKAHNIPVSDVHFHEIGAVDTIIDIVAAAYLVESINPLEIISSTVKVGKGLINSEHGFFPNPAIATINLLEGVPIERVAIDEELTTPTGALLVKYFTRSFSDTFEGKVLNSFYSTGSKDFGKYPNIFRVICFEPSMDRDAVYEIETNIDDMSGQYLSYAFNQLFNAGALDVFFTSVYSKKNRPAYKVNVICKPDLLDKMIDVIFTNTSTAGIRYSKKARKVLERSFSTIRYKDFDIRIKTLIYNGKEKKMPEWDDLDNISKKLNITPQELYNSIQNFLI